MVKFYVKIETTRPIIITITMMLDNPVIARIPNTESIHKSSRIPAIVWNGPGKIPIAHTITARINTSHKLTEWLLIVKIVKFGIEIPEIGG